MDAHLLSELADSKFLAKDYTGAIKDYDKLIELNSTNAELYNDRAMAEYYTRDYKNAVIDYSKAIKLNSNNADYYNNRGSARYALKDYSEAIADSDKVIEISPASAFAYNNRAFNKLCLNDYNGALADFKKAIELDPKVVQSYIGYAEVERIWGNNDSAITNLNHVIELDSTCDAAYRGLGLIQNDLFQLQLAFTNFQKSLSLNHAQLDVEHRIYLIRMQLGDHENAIKELADDLNSSNYKKDRAGLQNIGAMEPTVLEIGQFLTGTLSENDFLKHAGSPIWDSRIRKEQLCEAYYYVGMKRLIAGDKNGAKDYFQKCLGLGRPVYSEEGFDEYGSAEAELNNLNR